MKRRASGRQGVRALARHGGQRSDWRAGAQARWRTGFTLIEVVLAAAIFAIAVLGVFAAFLGASSLTEGSRNLTHAVEDARTIMERIRTDLQTSADVATFVADFPDTTYEQWVTDQQAAETAFMSLEDEAVDVAFGDADDDPLAVTVAVSWLERGRARSTSLQTQMTRR